MFSEQTSLQTKQSFLSSSNCCIQTDSLNIVISIDGIELNNLFFSAEVNLNLFCSISLLIDSIRNNTSLDSLYLSSFFSQSLPAISKLS